MPGRTNRPCASCPAIRSGSASAVQSTPCRRRRAVSTSIGRAGSRPRPVSSAEIPAAAATGSRKRRVEPDSPQSSTAAAENRPPSITISPAVRRMPAPMAARQRRVASISADMVRSEIRLSPFASAAQITARCPSLLEAGGRTLPHSGWGIICILLKRFPPL